MVFIVKLGYLVSFLITSLIVVLKKKATCVGGHGCDTALCANLMTPCFTNLHKQSDMLRNYGCIDSTVLWSYNTADQCSG